MCRLDFGQLLFDFATFLSYCHVFFAERVTSLSGIRENLSCLRLNLLGSPDGLLKRVLRRFLSGIFNGLNRLCETFSPGFEILLL